jgi:hypothetical protein
MSEELVVQKTSKKFNVSALISLVSGILSYALLLFHSLIDMKMILALFLAPITALIAIFTGSRAKRLIRKSDGLLGGKKMANTGLWLGWIYIIGIVLLTILAVVIFGGIVSGINSLLGSIGIG